MASCDTSKQSADPVHSANPSLLALLGVYQCTISSSSCWKLPLALPEDQRAWGHPGLSIHSPKFVFALSRVNTYCCPLVHRVHHRRQPGWAGVRVVTVPLSEHLVEKCSHCLMLKEQPQVRVVLLLSPAARGEAPQVEPISRKNKPERDLVPYVATDYQIRNDL
ncbi:hypothetical protein EK904_012771 [Melospiza melodia maxima]|nr:hypothetical protein EK904_012771 [Melospiza melodia maxima]